eukprot:gene14034-5609_t
MFQGRTVRAARAHVCATAAGALQHAADPASLEYGIHGFRWMVATYRQESNRWRFPTQLCPGDLCQPFFFHDDARRSCVPSNGGGRCDASCGDVPITSMPGQRRLTVDSLLHAAESAFRAG